MKRKGKTMEVACTLACTTTTTAAANEKKCSMRRQFTANRQSACLSVCHVPLFWEKHRAGEKAEKDLMANIFSLLLYKLVHRTFSFSFFLLTTLFSSSSTRTAS